MKYTTPLFLIAFLFLISPLSVHAAFSDTPEPPYKGTTGGSYYTMAQNEDTVYVGGAFADITIPGNIISLDLENQTIATVAAESTISGQFSDSVVDGEGNIYIYIGR